MLPRITVNPETFDPVRTIVHWPGGRVVGVFGRFSNSYLLVSEKAVGPVNIVSVDTGSPTDAGRARRFIENGWAGRDVRVKMILLTHLHLDHIAGIRNACSSEPVSVGMGSRARRLFSGTTVPTPGIGQWVGELIPIWIKEGCPIASMADLRTAWLAGFPGAHPRLLQETTVWFEDGDPLPAFPGWQVLSTPGHTDDSISLVNEELGLLFCGDVVLNFSGIGEFTRIVNDRGAMALTMRRVQALELQAIFPGHGLPLVGSDLAKRLRQRPQWTFWK
jgi:glyoxylase-like metal-dependent hydrolase (beta-lactamase superfamily II)